MSRRGGSSSANGIQLLPFLDILTCTMGALVTLLFAFARYGQQQVVQVSDAKQVAAESAAASEIEDLEWRASMLRDSRDKTEAVLGDARLELSHLEDHLRRLRQRAEQIHQAAIALENADPKASEAKSEADLAKLKERIILTSQELELARKNAAGRSTTYSIVPYAGPNQTRRRPIYIECRAEGVVLEPEGIVFTDSDFSGPLGPGNPLAAAVRAAREYMESKDPDSFDKVEPYPLLVVRPDAIPQYYAARSALLSFGSQFGYELIGADKKLKFPEPDPQMGETINSVVAEARARQAEFIAAAPRKYRNKSKPSFHVKPGGGGIEREPEPRTAQNDRNPYAGIGRRGSGGSRGNGGNGPGGNGPGGNGAGGNGPGGTSTGTTTGTYTGTTTGTGRGTGGLYAGTDGVGGAGGTGAGGGDPLGVGNIAGGGEGDGYGTADARGNGRGNSGAGALGPGGYGTGALGPGGYGTGGGPNGSGGAAGGGPGGYTPGGGGGGGGGYGPGGLAGGANGSGYGQGSGGGPGTPGGVPGAGLSALAGNGGAAGAGGGAGGSPTGAPGSGESQGGAGQGDTDGNGGDGTGGKSPGSPGQGGIGAGGGAGGRVALGGMAQPDANGVSDGSTGGSGTALTTTLQGTGGSPAGSTQGNGSGTGPGGGGLGGLGGNPAGNQASTMPTGPQKRGNGGGAAVPNTRVQQATNGNGYSLGGGADDTGPTNSTTSGGSMASGGSANSGSSGSSGGTNSGGTSGGSSSPGGQQSAIGMPNLNFGQQPQDPTQTGKHGKKNGGQNRPPGWGLPDAPATSASVARPVVIECWSDKLVMLGDDGKSVVKQIPLTQHTEDAVDELVSSVWQQMKQWGAAGKGLSWRPTLTMRVAPDAHPRFEELQTLLADSGLEVKESTHKLPVARKSWNPLRK